MRSFQKALLNPLGLYLLGALTALSCLLIVPCFGQSFYRAGQYSALLMLGWYLICSVLVGGFVVVCKIGEFITSILQAWEATGTHTGWNLEYRPSLQELEKIDPELARNLGLAYDVIDEANRGYDWKYDLFCIAWLVSIFLSFIIGATVLFVSYHAGFVWWQFIVATVIFSYGTVAYLRYNRTHC